MRYLEANEPALIADGLEQSRDCLGDCSDGGAWVLSGKGKRNTCAKKCQKLGKTCNASKMDELDTGAKLRSAMAAVGVSCDKVSNSNKMRKKEGVPGLKTTKKGSNVCFPSRIGNPTACGKQIRDGKFRSLCWCE